MGAGLTPFLPALPTGAAAILGMASYFAGVVQAPVTTIVVVLETTDGAAMTLPLMATALLAYGISRLVSPEPIYHALSKQFLPKHTEPALQGEPR
ncbi:chloride channel protein [Benzoatithermus flavus]|uniref:Chloride channel protein n=1 Tax=Benzoatithermus flavus TaxID=3108223 RepID=A0ABU8XVT6_9PROT